MSNNLSDLLVALDTINKNSEKEIFIPSLNKSISSKPLTAEHTRKIMKTAVDGPFSDNQLNLVMFEILTNLLNEDLSKLNTYDKIFIWLQIRSLNVSDSVLIENEVIHLSNHIDSLKKKKEKFDSYDVQVDTFSVKLNFPSIVREYQFESFLNTNYISKIDSPDLKNLKTLVTPLFVNNIISYFEEIKLNDVIIDCSVIPISDMYVLFDKLPAKVITEIINTIDTNFGNRIQKLTKIKKKDDTLIELTLNSEFFLN